MLIPIPFKETKSPPDLYHGRFLDSATSASVFLSVTVLRGGLTALRVLSGELLGESARASADPIVFIYEAGVPFQQFCASNANDQCYER